MPHTVADTTPGQLQDVDTDNSGEIDIDEFIGAMKRKYKDVEGEQDCDPQHTDLIRTPD